MPLLNCPLNTDWVDKSWVADPPFATNAGFGTVGRSWVVNPPSVPPTPHGRLDSGPIRSAGRQNDILPSCRPNRPRVQLSMASWYANLTHCNFYGPKTRKIIIFKVNVFLANSCVNLGIEQSTLIVLSCSYSFLALTLASLKHQKEISSPAVVLIVYARFFCSRLFLLYKLHYTFGLFIKVLEILIM